MYGPERDISDLAILVMDLLRKDITGTTTAACLVDDAWQEKAWPGWQVNECGRPSAEVIDLLDKMLDSDEPLTIDDCLEHAWFVEAALPPPFVSEAAKKEGGAFKCVLYRAVQLWPFAFAFVFRRSRSHAPRPPPPLFARSRCCARGALLSGRYAQKLAFKTSKHGTTETRAHHTLLAPPIASIDCEALPYTEENNALTVLGSDGVFYVRGVKYTIDEGGYLGGGTFGKVWKARRDADAPPHDQADQHDTIAPLLNKEYLVVKICKTASDKKAKAARREIQMTARAGHYVPGVVRMLAASSIVRDDATGELTGSVRIDDMKWAVQPEAVYEPT